MAFEGEQFVATGCVPDLDRLIHAARDDLGPIRAERHTHDRTCVAWEGERRLATDCVPDLDRLIHAARDDLGPIRAERHTHDRTCVAWEGLDRALAGGPQEVVFPAAQVPAALLEALKDESKISRLIVQ